jgi:hypothetical protein
MEIKNAIIDSATLSTEDHGCLSSFIGVDYGDSGHQGFGGWALYLPKSFTHHELKSIAGHWIFRVMQIAAVGDWSKLEGKSIRVAIENDLIIGIGHITKEDWFYPNRDFAKND